MLGLKICCCPVMGLFTSLLHSGSCIITLCPVFCHLPLILCILLYLLKCELIICLMTTYSENTIASYQTLVFWVQVAICVNVYTPISVNFRCRIIYNERNINLYMALQIIFLTVPYTVNKVTPYNIEINILLDIVNNLEIVYST